MYTINFNNEKLLYKDFAKIPEKNRKSIFTKLDDLSINGL
jgi:hypothetical protein